MIGKIVCSTAGNDKGRFSVIIKTEEDRLYIADGKRHKLSSPKSKNSKHLAFTDTTLNIEELKTDKSLRKALAIYRSNNK